MPTILTEEITLQVQARHDDDKSVVEKFVEQMFPKHEIISVNKHQFSQAYVLWKIVLIPGGG